MKRRKRVIGLVGLFSAAMVILLPTHLYALVEAPHNRSNNISCGNCHGSGVANSPFWGSNGDGAYNNFCFNTCHKTGAGRFNEAAAPFVKTHSSVTTNSSRATWEFECITCHNPHSHQQNNWNARNTAAGKLYLASGTLGTPGVYDPGEGTTTFPILTITYKNANWQASDPSPHPLKQKTTLFRGAILVPNAFFPAYNYAIYDMASDGSSLTLRGNLTNAVWVPMVAFYPFKIIYGQYIRSVIDKNKTPGNPGDDLTVRFYDQTGAGSFADGDATYDGICEVCHADTSHFRRDGTGPDQNHANVGGAAGTNCTAVCHQHTNGFAHGDGGAGAGGCSTEIACHGTHPQHLTHTGTDVGLTCDVCHDTSDYPKLWDGQDINGSAACDNCHSTDGVADARQYFKSSTRWIDGEGVAGFCGSCHDGTPGNSRADGLGDDAQDIMGDNFTYGYFVTGHGKASGNYQPLSWQEAGASGNPAANEPCSGCHDIASQHFGNPGKRLKAGFENDDANSNCDNCHGNEAVLPSATADPQYYTTSDDYEASAHGGKLCTDCHDVHGMAGASRPAMTKAARETLCYQCHTNGMVRNLSISGEKGSHTGADNAATLIDSAKGWTGGALVGKTVMNLSDGSSGTITANTATTISAILSGGIENDWDSGDSYVFNLVADDIQEAFGKAEKHDLGTGFEVGGKNYTLQCISCHNVHVITGRYWQAGSGKTPVTRFPPGEGANLQPWGDGAGEKMADYAAGGTYRTPKSDLFPGSQLPDYGTFCLDCHGDTDGHANFNIDWNGDPHGRQSANQPNGYSTCPDWYACGKAFGWDNDDCVGTQEECWPVLPRGAGDQLFSRPAYTHADRVAGANFTLSCSDCHEAHGSDTASMLRANPNGGTGSVTWNVMCNNCHYYYSDWHAGMSCGTASCHTANSIHRMGAKTGSGGTRTFNPDLVLSYSFDNNLNDSGGWQIDGKWMDDLAGSFVAGKSGQAVVLGGGRNVQVGTTNAYWSTDAGRHGTWVYTEMKYNTTLESWVYPTDGGGSEFIIFSKHTGYNTNGGYQFALKKINNTLRAVFNMAADNNAGTQDGRAGVRGAFSSVVIPLNTWTHVAATFDTAGPDRNPADQKVGRIRIYVNGEDVTTSSTGGDNRQPGAGETSIYAYSENSPWNEGICYDGNWCTSEFAIGGFYGWQNEFIGRLDEAKVWNVTKNAAYFDAYDSQAGPYISMVEGNVGSNQLTVTFSEEVYTSIGSSGALVAGDFTLTDTDNGRTITGVSHSAGSATAVLTLSSSLDSSNDINVDTLAAKNNAIYDDHDIAAGTAAVSVTMASTCPSGTVTFNLNEAPGSANVLDATGLISGQVNGGGATLTGSAYSGGGDASGRYLDFENNDTCLQATSSMTLEARIKPAGIGTANYIRRIIERNSGNANYQLSVWRNNSFGNYSAPDGQATIVLWVSPENWHGGNSWKPVMSNYDGAKTGAENDCQIVSDHWYLVKVVWNAGKPGGVPDQFFVPADIFVDDQGTDGAGAGENWSGSLNCTDSDQSLKNDDNTKLYTGDTISAADGDFTIGTNVSNHANNLFNGLIDWIIWQNTVD